MIRLAECPYCNKKNLVDLEFEHVLYKCKCCHCKKEFTVLETYAQLIIKEEIK